MEGLVAETTAKAISKGGALTIYVIGHVVSEMGCAGREGRGPTCKAGRNGCPQVAATT